MNKQFLLLHCVIHGGGYKPYPLKSCSVLTLTMKKLHHFILSKGLVDLIQLQKSLKDKVKQIFVPTSKIKQNDSSILSQNCFRLTMGLPFRSALKVECKLV